MLHHIADAGHFRHPVRPHRDSRSAGCIEDPLSGRVRDAPRRPAAYFVLGLTEIRARVWVGRED